MGLAKASQGEGSCGVAPDEAALVIRAQGGLQRGVVPEWEWAAPSPSNLQAFAYAVPSTGNAFSLPFFRK